MGTTNVLLNDEAQKIVQKVYKLGGGSSLYTYYVKTVDTAGSVYTFTFQGDDPELNNYDQVAQYLLSKGYYEHIYASNKLQQATPILGVALDRTSSGNIITGLYVKQGEKLLIKGRKLYISSGQLYSEEIELKSDNFKIVLITG